MANYLLAKRHVRCLKAAVALTAALKALSGGEVVVPLVVLPVEAGVVDRQMPLLQVTVSNLWGEPAAGDVRLTLETVAVAGALPGLFAVALAAAGLRRGRDSRASLSHFWVNGGFIWSGGAIILI